MTFGSLFAGIGGLDLGLERAGIVCKWQVENEPYCIKVLEKHWPHVPKWRDVRYFLGGKRWRKCRAAWDVDLICGGFPCQDISNAGRRAGIDGSRSGLWTDFARVIRLLRPRYVLVENVPALVIRGLSRVLGDLAQLGYSAEWDRIPAAAVGAPHLRWRLFIVAYAPELQRPPIERSEPDGAGESLVADPHQSGREGRPQLLAGREQSGFVFRGPDASDANGALRQESENAIRSGRQRLGSSRPETLPDAACRWSGQRWRDEFAAFCQTQRDLYWPDPQPWIRGMDDRISHRLHSVAPTLDGVPDRANRLRGLGNAVLPQIAEWVGRRLLEYERSSNA